MKLTKLCWLRITGFVLIIGLSVKLASHFGFWPDYEGWLTSWCVGRSWARSAPGFATKAVQNAGLHGAVNPWQCLLCHSSIATCTRTLTVILGMSVWTSVKPGSHRLIFIQDQFITHMASSQLSFYWFPNVVSKVSGSPSSCLKQENLVTKVTWSKSSKASTTLHVTHCSLVPSLSKQLPLHLSIMGTHFCHPAHSTKLRNKHTHKDSRNQQKSLQIQLSVYVSQISPNPQKTTESTQAVASSCKVTLPHSPK